MALIAAPFCGSVAFADAKSDVDAGNKLMGEGKPREAALRFDSAAKSSAKSTTFLSAAKAWKAASDPVKAADRYAEALELGDLGPKERLEANKALADLERGVGTVAVTGDPTMQVMVDGGPPAHPIATRHGTAGPHVLTIRSGAREVTKRVVLVAGEELAIELAPTMLAEEPPPPLASVTPLSSAEPPPPPPAKRSSTPRTIGFVGFGLTAIAAGAAVGIGVAALGARDDFRASPTQMAYDKATKLQTTTNVLWVTTAALGAVSAGLVIAF